MLFSATSLFHLFQSSFTLYHLSLFHFLNFQVIFRFSSIPQLKDLLLNFHYLAIRNSAAMNIYVPSFAWTHVFNSLEYIPQRYNCWSMCNCFFFPKKGLPFLIPISQVCRFQSLHISIITYCYLPF